MISSRERLIVFTRFPVPGKVKTRLIPVLGAEGATGLHRQLTLRTLRTAAVVAQQRGLGVEIHFDGGNESAMRHWLGDGFIFRSQSRGDLGERMSSSFAQAFRNGADTVVIIGSDCPELSPELLHAAFDKLSNHPVLLGPATDGGYYLIGLRQPMPELFQGIIWGSDIVLSDTLGILARTNVQPELLDPLGDIDTPTDLVLWNRVTEAEQADPRRLSIIIPTLNEAANIKATVEAVIEGNPHEVLVVDGGSSDETARLAREAGAIVISSSPGRSRQMNAGATRAFGTSLLFLHADTILSPGYATAVVAALRQPGVIGGAFRFQIDQPVKGKSILEWSTNLRSRWLQMPYGDQGLFLNRSTFEQLGGFAEMPIMEDYEFVRRIRRLGRIKTLPLPAKTSARRWHRLGIIRNTVTNILMILGYHAKIPPGRLAKFYRSSSHPPPRPAQSSS
jgi:rSAM/selenodomain-associated transferase 2/rSAM/selenodomain-associated transferase 1